MALILAALAGVTIGLVLIVAFYTVRTAHRTHSPYLAELRYLLTGRHMPR